MGWRHDSGILAEGAEGGTTVGCRAAGTRSEDAWTGLAKVSLEDTAEAAKKKQKAMKTRWRTEVPDGA